MNAAAKRLSYGIADGRPLAPWIVGELDARALDDESSNQDDEEQQQNDCVVGFVRLQPAGAQHITIHECRRDCERKQKSEDVQGQRLEDEIKPAVHDGDMKIFLKKDNQRSQQQKEESPVEREVVQACAAIALQQFLVQSSLAKQAGQTFTRVVEAVSGASDLPQPPPPIESISKHTQSDDEEQVHHPDVLNVEIDFARWRHRVLA